MSNGIMAEVKHIMAVTGHTEEEVVAALQDCGDVDSATNRLLDSESTTPAPPPD